MKTFRHSTPVSQEDILIARAAVRNWKAATGADRSRLFRENIAALQFWDWACRAGVESEANLSAAPAAVPSLAAKKPDSKSVSPITKTNARVAGGATSHKHVAGDRVVIFPVGSKKLSADTAFLSAASATRAAAIGGKSKKCGVLYSGHIRTFDEMHKLLGKKMLHLRDLSEHGAKLVRF